MPTPLDRVFEAAGCRTQTELAVFLGIRQSSISLAKRKGNIPSDWLLTLWRKTGINPDWIMTGQGPKGVQPIESAETLKPSTVYLQEVRPLEESSLEELMAEVVKRVQKKATN